MEIWHKARNLQATLPQPDNKENGVKVNAEN